MPVRLILCEVFMKPTVAALCYAKHSLSFLSNQNGMRYLLLFYFVLLLFVSCQEGPKNDVVVKGESIVSLPVAPEQIAGMYIGEFRGSPLSIVLNQVTDKQANGYDMHRGIKRTVSGVVEFSDGQLHLYVVEPGDSRFDGQFHLAIDTANWRGEGTWKSFVTGTEIPFSFQKREIKKVEKGQVFVDAMANYIVLNGDATCLFNHRKDTAGTTPPIMLKGRYTKEKDKVIINWEKKAGLPAVKSVYRLITERASKDEGYKQQTLIGEGNIFHQLVF
jgi:hypothetical protein